MLRLSLRIARPYNARLRKPCPWCAAKQHSQSPKAFSNSHLQLDRSKSDKPKVRWFQQLLPWSSEKRPADPNNPDADELGETEWLKSEIDRLEDELSEMRGGDKEGKTLIEPLLKELKEEDRRKVREAIRREEIKETQKIKEVAEYKRKLAQHAPKQKELEIQWRLPPEQNTYLSTLNEYIRKAAANLADQGVRKKLWQSYSRCKAFLPPFLHLIPERSWSTLWASQQTFGPQHPLWAPHLIVLSEDMQESGKELTAYQWILYVDALNREGRQDVAIAQWKDLGTRLEGDRKASAEHELLGVRLFASQGNPERAEEIALAHLNSEGHEDSRILVPLLGAWVQRGDEIGIKHAWALYLQFRTLMGSNVTMDDFDNIATIFLNAGRTDFALAVFKDLMLVGKETGEESIELYRTSLGVLGKTQSSAVSVEDLNKISLTGLIELPRKFQNKFFYGSWLKKLIGMDQVDAAASVIELMFERGIKPDARHLNGIIGAWLRASSDRKKEKAEQMAWAMIYERLDFVKKRRKGDLVETDESPKLSEVQIPPHLRRTVASATIETFSLLLLHYGRRSQEQNVQLLQNCLAMAQIRPNSYFINHLLYIDLRRGQHQTAWIKYQHMFRKIRPDLETFACLWDCEKAHLDSLMIHDRDKFPGPRVIMREMVSWLLTLKPKERELVREDFSRQMYDQVVRCLGLASDNEGSLVALYSLKEYFGFYPDRDTARMVSIQVGRMGVGEPSLWKPGRSRHKKNPMRRDNAAKFARVFEIIAEQRERVLGKHGMLEMKQTDEAVQKEEGLYILAEFLRTILRRLAVVETEVEHNIEKAAWEMGVGGIHMDDPLRYYDENRALKGISAPT